MATERQRAQRRLARQIRQGYKPQFSQYSRPSREMRRDYLEFLLDNPDAITDADRKMLARHASYARWEQEKPGSHPNANPRYEIWSEFFYHRR